MATMVVMELFDTLRKSTHNFLFIICLVNSFFRINQYFSYINCFLRGCRVSCQAGQMSVSTEVFPEPCLSVLTEPLLSA